MMVQHGLSFVNVIGFPVCAVVTGQAWLEYGLNITQMTDFPPTWE